MFECHKRVKKQLKHSKGERTKSVNDLESLNSSYARCANDSEAINGNYTQLEEDLKSIQHEMIRLGQT